jgi:hypothetical protein
LELGLTYLLIAALIRLRTVAARDPRFEACWLVVLCLSAWLLSVLTVLGIIWLSALFLILPALFSVRELSNWIRQQRFLFGTTALALLPCVCYYLWTRSLGTRAASFTEIGWKNLGFILYEQLGFNGLGPGRLALREGGLSALRPWVPLLGVYAAAVCIVSIVGLRGLIRSGKMRLVLAVVVAIAVPTAFLVAIGFLMHFRVLGRHCTPTVAVIAFLFMRGTTSLCQCKRWWAPLGIAVFLSLTLLSCLSQRFAYRHAKDDYRSAVRIAEAALAQGKSVWWNADPLGCEYYHLNSSRSGPRPGTTWILMNPVAGFEKGIALPDLVVVSKPDAYDTLGGLQTFLKREGYNLRETLPAFAIFGRPDQAPKFYKTDRM